MYKRQLLFHANVFTAHACLKHSYFLKVKVLDYAPLNEEQTQSLGRCRWRYKYTTHSAGLNAQFRNPTTSFLTATTLIYAIGAGITAAAGTRLALQLFLAKRFKLFSFKSRKNKIPRVYISCHYLLDLRLGNLRACCLP